MCKDRIPTAILGKLMNKLQKILIQKKKNPDSEENVFSIKFKYGMVWYGMV